VLLSSKPIQISQLAGSLSNHLLYAGFWLRRFSTLKMEMICFSEMLVHIRTTWRYIPQDGYTLSWPSSGVTYKQTWFGLVAGFIHFPHNSNNLQTLTLNCNKSSTIITYSITSKALIFLHLSLSLFTSTCTAITTFRNSVQYLQCGALITHFWCSGVLRRSDNNSLLELWSSKVLW
jgi:hypothetical protein